MSIRRTAKKLISKAAWHAYNMHRKGVRYSSLITQTAALLDAPREYILAFQKERLEKLLQHAYDTTPYYSEFAKRGSANLWKIPPLEKRNIREQLERLCSDEFPQQQCIMNATGGSTGTPLTFYQDRNYWNQRNLSVYYFDRWAGWDFGEPQLIIWGALSDMDGDGHWKYQLNNFWRNHHWLNGFRLTDATMQTAFRKMDRRHPQTILAYPSSLYQFATFLFESGLVPQVEFKRNYRFGGNATFALSFFSRNRFQYKGL